MPDNSDRDEAQQLWSGMEANSPRVSADAIRAHAERIEAHRRRKAILLTILMLSTLVFPVGTTLLSDRPLSAWEQAGLFYLAVLTGVFLALAVGSIRRRNSLSKEEECLRFYRSMLVRERNLNRGLLPVRVAILLTMFAAIAALSWWTGRPWRDVWIAGSVLLTAAAPIWLLSLRKARACQKQLDLLDQ